MSEPRKHGVEYDADPYRKDHPSMPTSRRIPGHALRHEGAAHTKAGTRILASTSREGCGACSCGQVSAWLPSASARKRWHREHKGEVYVLLDRDQAPPRHPDMGDDEVWAWNLDVRQWQITSIPLHVDGNLGGSPAPVEDDIEAGA